MEWENKVKMVQLGNNREKSKESKKEFQKFVLDNISDFDEQAWDMFCNLTTIIPDEMRSDMTFWEGVYSKIKNIDCNAEKFGFRSGLRISMIQTVCENELNLNK
jgi:hypothetical protein